MGRYTRTEIAVGLFIVAGALALAYLAFSLGAFALMPQDRIHLSARFSTAGELKKGAPVKLAGVPVGRVTAVGIEEYAAAVQLAVDASLELPADTIASIRTTGLLGEAYVSLSPGASEANLQDGGRIMQTQPPVDLMELISKYAFGSAVDENGAPAEPGGDDDL